MGPLFSPRSECCYSEQRVFPDSGETGAVGEVFYPHRFQEEIQIMKRLIGVLVVAFLVLGTTSQAFAQSKRVRQKSQDEGCGCGQEQKQKQQAEKREKAPKIDKEWLKSLPPERRKQALERLKKMNPEQREQAIKRFKQAQQRANTAPHCVAVTW